MKARAPWIALGLALIGSLAALLLTIPYLFALLELEAFRRGPAVPGPLHYLPELVPLRDVLAGLLPFGDPGAVAQRYGRAIMLIDLGLLGGVVALHAVSAEADGEAAGYRAAGRAVALTGASLAIAGHLIEYWWLFDSQWELLGTVLSFEGSIMFALGLSLLALGLRGAPSFPRRAALFLRIAAPAACLAYPMALVLRRGESIGALVFGLLALGATLVFAIGWGVIAAWVLRARLRAVS